MAKLFGVLAVVLCLAIAAQAWECSTAPFGVATDYNLFVLGNVRSCESDTEGRVAALGSIDFQSYSVGAALGSSSNQNLPNSLISAAAINFSDGSVWAGGISGNPTTAHNVAILIDSAAHWSNECCPASECSVCASSATEESPIDFPTVSSCLYELDSYWSGLPQTAGSTVSQAYNTVTLTCNHDHLANVFDLSFDETVTEIVIVCPATHTVLINYRGVEAVQNLGYVLEGGVGSDKIIHHFDSPTLHVAGVEIPGTTFAPRTSVYFEQGLSSGAMIVAEFDAPPSNSYGLSAALSDECTKYAAGHAIWMSGVADLVFEESSHPAITYNDDGTATITGRASDGSIVFDSDVTISGYTTTAPSGSPKLELKSSCYTSNGGEVDPSTWDYYTVVSGTLTGVADSVYAGAVLEITRRGPAVQVGDGANGKNVNNGLSFWFDWNVTVQGATPLSNGVGDYNIDINSVIDNSACPRGQVNHVPFTGCVDVPEDPQCVYVDTCDCCDD